MVEKHGLRLFRSRQLLMLRCRTAQLRLFFKERDSLITTLFLLPGLRVSELVSIDLKHFNEDDGALTVIGKGNKERKLVLTPGDGTDPSPGVVAEPVA